MVQPNSLKKLSRSFWSLSSILTPLRTPGLSLYWESLHLEWWADSETFQQAKMLTNHLPGVSDKHNILKTYAYVDDICRELELRWIASVHQHVENRLLSIQPKLWKIQADWWLRVLVLYLCWIARGTGATQWYLVDEQLMLLLPLLSLFSFFLLLPCLWSHLPFLFSICANCSNGFHLAQLMRIRALH